MAVLTTDDVWRLGLLAAIAAKEPIWLAAETAEHVVGEYVKRRPEYAGEELNTFWRQAFLCAVSAGHSVQASAKYGKHAVDLLEERVRRIGRSRY